MYAKKTNDGEVAKHAIKTSRAIFTSHGHWLFVPFHCCQLFGDLGLLYERVEDVEYGIAAPSIRIISEYLGIFLVRIRSSYAIALSAEGFELVDELVDNIPSPEILSYSLVTA